MAACRHSRRKNDFLAFVGSTVLLLLVTSIVMTSELGPTTAEALAPSFLLEVDRAVPLTAGTTMLPPMVSVPCRTLRTTSTAAVSLTELIKPPNVDALYEWYVTTRRTPDADPSWGALWPTAVALTNYLHARPELVRGRHVVELGAGLGLAGLTAATLGARRVTLTDREPAALHCALSTAACCHGLADDVVRGALLDWCRPDDAALEGEVDVVLASDVLYDDRTIDAFAATCRRLLGSGKTVLVTDPTVERSVGARALLRRSLGDDVRVTVEELPPLCGHDGAVSTSLDGLDHERRMQEPTVLIRCTLP